MLGKLIFKFHTIKLMNTPDLSPKGLFLFAEIHSYFYLFVITIACSGKHQAFPGMAILYLQ